MKVRFFEYFDYLLLLCVVLLVAIGVASIYSSGINSDGVNVSNEYVKQRRIQNPWKLKAPYNLNLTPQQNHKALTHAKQSKSIEKIQQINQTNQKTKQYTENKVIHK